MPPRQIRGEDSWNSLHHSEASGDNVDDGYSDDSMHGESDHDGEKSITQSPTFPTISDVHRALHPLQATAERVGKQVEEFATNLDRLSNKRQRKIAKDCRHVLPLVNAYKKIASDTIRGLEKEHAPERQKQLLRNTRRRLQSSSRRPTPGPNAGEDDKDHGIATTVEDLKRWEQEEQTWDLLGVMLQVEYPIQETRSSDSGVISDLARPSRDTEIHRYSSEKDVWDNFLATNDLAWERHTVLRWLQKCADKPGHDIDQVVAELESDADRGAGLWAHSWLYSKEAIKGQKRLRSWSKALEPDDPGLDTSLLNSEKTKVLVTQLDPDAITRQARSLEKQDHYFERAIWLACWEMVRRGREWDYVREWCQERVEGWRATAMRGDPRYSLSGKPSVANWQSRSLWRKTCALAAKDGGIDDYENAVYGVLSGYLPSVQNVSHSWDDYLFAHYNSYLLHSFEEHVRRNLPDRVPTTLADKDGPFNFSAFGGQRTQSGNQIVDKMTHLEATKEEAKEPLKMLQGSLIAKTFDEFIFKHGVRLAQAANAKGPSKILVPMHGDFLAGSVTAPISMDDHDLLRILTHIILIFQDLGLDLGRDDRGQAMENIIVAYVDYLSKAGKQNLLPVYASCLSPERSISCLGRQLPFIQDCGERQTALQLMEQYGIDVPGVLSAQLQMIVLDAAANTQTVKHPPLEILEKSEKDPLKLRSIRTDFIGNTITHDQADLIHGFEWYLLLEGQWAHTMAVGAVVYKHLLRTHGLAAARILSQTVTFPALSLSKTNKILGRSVDISKTPDDSEDEIGGWRSTSAKRSYKTGNRQRRRSSTASTFASERQILLDQAATFRDFETLFIALDALEEWKDLSVEAKKYVNPRQNGKAWKEAFQKAYQRVELTMDPLLHGWLQNPMNDHEAEEFKQIRIACLPEIVLAYNTILDFSSHYLSRDLLLKSMDMAALVATDESDLATCFVAADRMSELVDSFAFLSKTIIQADNRGAKGGKSKKKRNGESLDIWTVRAPLA